MAFMIGVLRGCTDGVWMGGFGRDGGGRDGGGRIGGGLDGASQDLRRTGSLYTTPARPYPLNKGCATALPSGVPRDMRGRAVGARRGRTSWNKCNVRAFGSSMHYILRNRFLSVTFEFQVRSVIDDFVRLQCRRTQAVCDLSCGCRPRSAARASCLSCCLLGVRSR